MTYSKIGVVSKTVNEQLNLRLIHDLRRSNVNAQVVMHERIVLPRIVDWIEDALYVQQGLSGAEDDWESLVLDFVDAFKHL